MSTSVETFTDSDKLVAAAGERLIDVIKAAIAARGRALIVLTGGGNGNRLMRFLASRIRADRLDQGASVLGRRSIRHRRRRRTQRQAGP